MSIWCEVHGTIEGDGLSVKRAIKEVFADEDLVMSNSSGDVLPTVSFSFCADGDHAYKLVKKFLEKLDSYKATYDLCTEIRWLK